ncbi:hypothetical protein AB1L88_26950, partial [Tautonia sp. JC769]|uniref:hypothetical protein n=1 Tax=Tautonia sp. JC769 TaxID=3232135 RepID=UPI00345A8794
LLERIGWRRKQLTIGGLMVVVAVIACLVNWFRPITQTEAARIAERRFLTLPGATRWEGRYRVQPRDLGDWSVLILDSGTDEMLAVVWVDRGGDVKSVGVGDELRLSRTGGNRNGGTPADKSQ